MGNEYQQDQSQQDQYGNTDQSGMPQRDQSGMQQDQYGNRPDQTGMQQDQSGMQQGQSGNQSDQTQQQDAGPLGGARRMGEQQVDQGIDSMGNKIPGGERFTGQAKGMASKGMDDLENEAEKRGWDMSGGMGSGGEQRGE